MGRTRDETNLRSFLGIKSGVSGKFGSQPAGSRVRPNTRTHVLTYTRCTREPQYYEIFNLSFAPLYITRVLIEWLVLLISVFAPVSTRDLP